MRLGIYSIACQVSYKCAKSESDFEKLEGRRNYLKPLIDKIIANANVSNMVINE